MGSCESPERLSLIECASALIIRWRFGDRYLISTKIPLLLCSVFLPQQDWVRMTCHIPLLSDGNGGNSPKKGVKQGLSLCFNCQARTCCSWCCLCQWWVVEKVKLIWFLRSHEQQNAGWCLATDTGAESAASFTAGNFACSGPLFG